MRKRLLSLLLGVAMAAVAVTGCATTETTVKSSQESGQSSQDGQGSSGNQEQPPAGKKDAENLTVGVSFATLGNDFYSALHDYLLQLCDAEGWKVITMDADNDVQQQITDIENLMTQDIDVLVLNPFVQDGFKDIIQKCREQGIYVVSVDNGVTSDTPVNATVLTDNFGNGEMVGAWAVKQLKDTPIRAYLISGDPGSEVGKLRRDGLIQGILEAQLSSMGKTDFQIVYQSYTEGWLNEVALKNFEDTAVAYDFNVIISESDNFIYECRDYLKEIGRDDVLFLSSADGSKRVLEAIKDGSYNGCTALNNYAKLDEKVVEVIKGLINGEEISGQIMTDPIAIDKDNVEQIYDPNWLT